MNTVCLGTVKNNQQGWNRINSLRKLFKDTPLKVCLEGRGHRFGRGNYHKQDQTVNGEVISRFDNRYQSSLPISKSERLAIYLREKPKYRYVKREVEVTNEVVTKELRWVRVPTKWGTEQDCR